jgi:hypothetical protein
VTGDQGRHSTVVALALLSSLVIAGLGAILGIVDMSTRLPQALEDLALAAFCVGSLGALLTYGRFKRQAVDESDDP